MNNPYIIRANAADTNNMINNVKYDGITPPYAIINVTNVATIIIIEKNLPPIYMNPNAVMIIINAGKSIVVANVVSTSAFGGVKQDEPLHVPIPIIVMILVIVVVVIDIPLVVNVTTIDSASLKFSFIPIKNEFNIDIDSDIPRFSVMFIVASAPTVLINNNDKANPKEDNPVNTLLTLKNSHLYVA